MKKIAIILVILIWIGSLIYILHQKQVYSDINMNIKGNGVNVVLSAEILKETIIFKKFQLVPVVNDDWTKHVDAVFVSPSGALSIKAPFDVVYNTDGNKYARLLATNLMLFTILMFSYHIYLRAKIKKLRNEKNYSGADKMKELLIRQLKRPYLNLEIIMPLLFFLVMFSIPWIHGNLLFWISLISWTTILSGWLFFNRFIYLKGTWGTLYTYFTD